MRRHTLLLALGLILTCCAAEVDARRKDKTLPPPREAGLIDEKPKHEKTKHQHGQHAAGGASGGGGVAGAAIKSAGGSAPAATTPPELSMAATAHHDDKTSASGRVLHRVLMAISLCMLFSLMLLHGSSSDTRKMFRRAASTIATIFALEGVAHLLAPQPHLSVAVMIFVAVVFTIFPVEDEGRPMGLHMGTVPPLCVLWLGGSGILTYSDLVRSLYGTASLRPYHLVVMFLGSVYLCTALERSGFLHTAALHVVESYGRSPWGLFWALSIFSGCLTVLIPDDIVTMTLTPITIRMCQLLNLPEVPYLFAQFFAGNIWAVTLVTGNPTNVLLAEDLGDTFVSFAGRMGIPGVCAGLTSFVLMWLTNRSVINAQGRGGGGGGGLGLSASGDVHYSKAETAERGVAGEAGSMLNASGEAVSCGSSDASSGSEVEASMAKASASERKFTRHGVICLVRVLTATLICALESVHGLPVYLVVLLMGLASFCLDLCVSVPGALDVLAHMPWELFSFVTGFLVLAEAMAITGISLWLASAFLPLVTSRDVAYVSGFLTMLFCNIFETLPATLIVFKMIDSVPAWKVAAIALAPAASQPLLRDAKRAALSAVIFGSNFGANTACIGSLGGLMMRRLALQQGVTVTNGMLLRQGIPVMIPTMFVACWVLIQQQSL